MSSGISIEICRCWTLCYTWLCLRIPKLSLETGINTYSQSIFSKESSWTWSLTSPIVKVSIIAQLTLINTLIYRRISKSKWIWRTLSNASSCKIVSIYSIRASWNTNLAFLILTILTFAFTCICVIVSCWSCWTSDCT